MPHSWHSASPALMSALDGKPPLTQRHNTRRGSTRSNTRFVSLSVIEFLPYILCHRLPAFVGMGDRYVQLFPATLSMPHAAYCVSYALDHLPILRTKHGLLHVGAGIQLVEYNDLVTIISYHSSYNT